MNKFYKNWPLWLKTGVITTIAALIGILLVVLTPWPIFEKLWFVFMPLLAVVSFPILALSRIINWGEGSFLSNVYLQMVISLIFWFIIGGLVGFITAEIKKKKY